MINGLTGIKIGMTRYFQSKEEGLVIPVTVIKVEPHRVVQVKTVKKDGYDALQVTVGVKKINHVNKSEFGHFSKSNIEVGRGLWEFYSDNNNDNVSDKEALIKIGEVITISLFSTIKKVDVTGISRGKGFSGTVKRWNFRSQDASHGNSLSHRAPGSIGQNQTPGKVFKGKKMAGQLGNIRVTVENLDIVFVDLKNDLLFIKGSVPGEINETLRIHISKKIFKKKSHE